ncbi:sensor histidine kinase [Terrarubrum flagellatum]|uniref:sensor histidine kinase n=1 Tax=Terrirubrum flagellatum TaxID=2895980 RepID=UPI003144EAA2
MNFSKSATAILVAAIIVTGGVLIFQWRALSRARTQVEHSLIVIERARAANAQMIDGETGQRGYIITQDPLFLEPYEKARREAPASLAALTMSTQDNPVQVRRLERLQSLWNERAARLAAVIELVQRGQIDLARERVKTGDGKALMDGIRAEVDDVVKEEQSLLSARLQRAESAERIGRVLLFVVIGLASASLLAMLANLRKSNKQLTSLFEAERRTARSLETARAELASTVSQTQLRLNDASRLLAAAVANAPIVVWNQDTNLVYRWFSGHALGQTPDYFIGRSDSEALPERIKQTVISNNLAVLESGQPRTYELLFPGKDGDSWFDVRIEPTRDGEGAINGLTGVAVEITDRKRREQNIRLLMREIAHRAKNILAVVQAMARQTAATTPEPQAFIDRFAARLEALGATHALLVDEGWKGADIGDLIRSQMGHQLDLIGKQIFLDGPLLSIPSEIAQNIGLALHELTTNASKYGALSVPEGRVDVSWAVTESANGAQDVSLQWIESGGPPVVPPKRKGFGQVVIERTVSRAVGGKVEMSYDPKGFSWKLSFQIRDSDENTPDAAQAAPGANQ